MLNLSKSIELGMIFHVHYDHYKKKTITKPEEEKQDSKIHVNNGFQRVYTSDTILEAMQVT